VIGCSQFVLDIRAAFFPEAIPHVLRNPSSTMANRCARRERGRRWWAISALSIGRKE
jgi:hypothetical protein